MFVPLFIFFSAIGVIALVIGVQEERQRLAEFVSPPAKPRARLLVFAFPSRRINMHTQRAFVEILAESWEDLVEVIFVNAFDQLEYATQFGLFTVPATLWLDTQGQVAFVNENLIELPELITQLTHLTTHCAAPPRAARRDSFQLEEPSCQS